MTGGKNSWPRWHRDNSQTAHGSTTTAVGWKVTLRLRLATHSWPSRTASHRRTVLPGKRYASDALTHVSVHSCSSPFAGLVTDLSSQDLVTNRAMNTTYRQCLDKTPSPDASPG